jgi:hypothetical protein
MEDENVLDYMATIFGGAILAFYLTGCGYFVKDIDAWGLKMSFPQGYSATVSTNTVDHSIDRKGLNVDRKAERY